MHTFDKDELLDYLEFAIDQSINFGTAYQNNNKNYKETIPNLEICGVGKTRVELIFAEVKEKIYEFD